MAIAQPKGFKNPVAVSDPRSALEILMSGEEEDSNIVVVEGPEEPTNEISETGLPVSKDRKPPRAR